MRSRLGKIADSLNFVRQWTDTNGIDNMPQERESRYAKNALLGIDDDSESAETVEDLPKVYYVVR